MGKSTPPRVVATLRPAPVAVAVARLFGRRLPAYWTMTPASGEQAHFKTWSNG